MVRRLGATLCKIGKYEEAIDEFTCAMEMDKNEISFYSLRGQVKEILGDFQGASEDSDLFQRLSESKAK